MLENAIKAAKAAIELEHKGKRAEAISKYVEAADWLVLVMKSEGDDGRRAKLRERAEEYVASAERLNKAPAPVAARAEVSTAGNYFSADDRFKADVERARSWIATLERKGEKFEDPDFSTPLPGRRPAELGWEELFANGGPRPADVDQGALGDCWLLSSLCVLAGFPELVRRLVVGASKRAGAYVARLCYAGEWRLVLIDDRFPCKDGRPAFARSSGAYWVPVLEKAVAKLFGSYSELENGTAAEALGVLTGLPTETIEELHLIGDPSRRDRDDIRDLDGLFAELSAAFDEGYIVAASCGHASRPEAEYARTGLKFAHEYAVLRVVKVDAARLVQLRNPWARGEWRGRWSRRSPQWKTGTGAKVLAIDTNHAIAKDDGVFWMQLEDLVTFFHELTICRLRRNYHQHRHRVDVKPLLSSPTTAFRIAGPAKVDACLLQATERGKVPKGHHVMADVSLIVFRAPSNDVRTWRFLKTTRRGALSPIIAADFDADGGYAVLPLCFNWRVLKLSGVLTAVFYASRQLAVSRLDLAPNDAALALREAVVNARPARDHFFFDLDGIHLVENRRSDARLHLTLTLGRSTNCVSSRHGGVLDDAQPAGAYATRDIIPPNSFMFVLFRVPYRPSWSVEGTSLKWKFIPFVANTTTTTTTGGGRDDHYPPIIIEPASLHSTFPIPPYTASTS
ncbi:hypothetical protein CTAYLR_003135 [Chrysophaeum taylorii]|uniref:Calpain catalytic domain-containing protein n=1 Tax=Chrysophaeum taylorii TaxID=2483200 RepID=A0AAD7UP09_9STRA|nr:hypothetical protein CTAYLR_003135 [Chrysophaeum taylorii]